MNGYDLLQHGCEALSLSPSVLNMALSISNDQHGVIKKPAQVKFNDLTALSVLPQVQKNMQSTMIILSDWLL